MTLELANPSFWPEPRDPSAWQRALRRVVDLASVPDPRPCWAGPLRSTLPRRAVAGLYGRKSASSLLLGASLLVPASAGWALADAARPMLTLEREAFHLALARWLVLRSAWLRLALRRLAVGRWVLREGALEQRRALRIGVDLLVDSARPDAGEGVMLVGERCNAEVAPHDLSPLHSPLYLVGSLGWLDDDRRPRLPADLAAGLTPATAATVLRAVTATHADGSGFVAVDVVARALWTELCGEPAPRSVARWSDEVFGAAIAAGTLEVHAWAPGQPRHGRGLFGDRDRKRARWTVHDDFTVSPAAASPLEGCP